jgi:glyoxylase-like metal-dependent hydrolase (beta-lactamase superfamily II)
MKKKLILAVLIIIGLLVVAAGAGFFFYTAPFKTFTPMETGALFDDVFAIKTKFVNAYVIKINDTSYIAIDAGFEKKSLLRGMKQLNINPDYVRKVFLTHTDYDHVAGIKAFNNADVFISKEESVMADGSVHKGPFMNNKISVKYSCLNAGQEISVDGNSVEIIPLFGHTVGHSGYLINKKYLFTGDAIKITDGKAEVFVPAFNMDTKKLKESIKVLKKYSNVTAFFTAHFGYSTTPQSLFSGLN